MPTTERVALISDVHGNLTAMHAVLADCATKGIATIYNLGDVVGKGPRGSEAVRLTRQHCARTVRGNWDDFLPVITDGSPALMWWQSELSEADRTWLRALPLAHDIRLSGRTIRLFHASADSVYTRIHVDHTAEQFDEMFAATELTGPVPVPDVVAYGDIHDAYLKTRHGRTLINVGSVGNPLDQPTACYVIIEGVPDGGRSDLFGVQFVRVPYDIEAEIAAAQQVGMPELEPYARELRTAVYRGLHHPASESGNP